MFKKTERLTKLEFNSVFKSGRRFNSAHLTVVYSPDTSLHASVVVGKKVARQAVRRNTLRRRIYARLRLILKANSVTGVYIVILKPSYNSLGRKAADQFLTESIAEMLKST